MRVLVTGSRNWAEEWVVRRALGWALEAHARPVVVHGGAKGADSFAEKWAQDQNVPSEIWRPDYKTGDPKTAPLRRNDAMLDSGIDLVLAFMLGTPEKGGTLYTVNGARARRIPLILYQWPGDPDFKE
jgi:hypothetical protein